MKTGILALLILGAVACGGSVGGSVDDGGQTDTPSPADTDPPPADDDPPAPPPPAPCKSPNALGPTADDPRWCDVDTLLTQALAAPANLPGYAVEIYTQDADGNPVLQYSNSAGTVIDAGGDTISATPTTPVKIASASKYLTAVTVLRAVTLAAHDLRVTPVSLLQTKVGVLGCSGVAVELRNATLSQVLHQIAGLSAEDNACLNDPGSTLQSCACSILAQQYTAGPPGTNFVYGSASFTVAAAMAEHATGVAFDDQITALAAALGADAPDVVPPAGYNFAGGFTASTRSYMPFLALAMPGANRGSATNGTQLIDPDLFDAMATPFDASVTLADSPFMAAVGAEVRYGLGSWVQCTAPWQSPASWPADLDSFGATLDYTSCAKKVQHSEGKFGFLPWISFPTDATGQGHMGIFGTRMASNGEERVSLNSFLAFYMIEPVIADILP